MPRGVLPVQRRRLQMMPRPRQFHALAHQAAEIHVDGIPRDVLVADFAGLQHLLDRPPQPVGVVQHQFVELLALRFVHVAPLQSLEVEADGRDRGLQFMSDGVDEAVVIFVQPDFAHQEARC